MTIPPWVDEQLPNAGPCLICGVPGMDWRHRILDAIQDRVLAGEGEEDIARDYDFPVEFVERIAREYVQ